MGGKDKGEVRRSDGLCGTIPGALFETVDNRSFAYTSDQVVEIEQKLYELELLLEQQETFVRSSKSQIINMNKIIRLKPELNRTIQAVMCNGERLYISRRYAQGIKRRLGIIGG